MASLTAVPAQLFALLRGWVRGTYDVSLCSGKGLPHSGMENFVDGQDFSFSEFFSLTVFDAWHEAVNMTQLSKVPPLLPVDFQAVRKKAIEIINEDRAALVKNGKPVQNLPKGTSLEKEHINLGWFADLQKMYFSRAAGAPVPAPAATPAPAPALLPMVGMEQMMDVLQSKNSYIPFFEYIKTLSQSFPFFYSYPSFKDFTIVLHTNIELQKCRSRWTLPWAVSEYIYTQSHLILVFVHCRDEATGGLSCS